MQEVRRKHEHEAKEVWAHLLLGILIQLQQRDGLDTDCICLHVCQALSVQVE